MRLIRKISPVLAEDEDAEKNVQMSRENIVSGFLMENERKLLKNIFYYVKKANIWGQDELWDIAAEIWSETKQTALEKADELDLERQPLAWLLKTALFHIRRRRSHDLKTDFHETLASDAKPNEIEIFDKLVGLIDRMNLPDDVKHYHWQSWKVNEAAQIITEICERQQIKILLAPCNTEEKRIIILAKIYELNGKELGKALGISPDAARQRLARALGKLREFWRPNENNENDKHE